MTIDDCQVVIELPFPTVHAMSHPLLPICMISDRQRPYSFVRFFCLAAIMLPGLGFGIGCGGSSADQSSSSVVQDDAVGDFEWGMKRLKRALRNFRPSGDGGFFVTDRNVEDELIPPNEKTPYYTARVTVTSKGSFMHAKRGPKKEKPEAEQDEESKIEDPLAEKDDDLSKYLDIPGTGSRSSSGGAVSVGPRELDIKSVFELAYIEGHWKLTKTPEKKYQQLWFEYAFD